MKAFTWAKAGMDNLDVFTGHHPFHADHRFCELLNPNWLAHIQQIEAGISSGLLQRTRM